MTEYRNINVTNGRVEISTLKKDAAPKVFIQHGASVSI